MTPVVASPIRGSARRFWFQRAGLWRVLAALGYTASSSPAMAADWPQWRGPNRDNIWSESIAPAIKGPWSLRIRWQAPVGFGFASPVVVGHRVFVLDLQLDRSASHERVHCFDDATGRTLWAYAYPVTPPEWAFTPGQESGPNATPVVDGGRLYTLGWHGHLRCLDGDSGAVVWARDLARDHPESELRTTSSPMIEGRLLILVIGGKPDACVVALDKGTGREVWRALREGAGYSSPVILVAGGTRQLIVWTPESVSSLDPASGALYWRKPMAIPADMVVSSPVAFADRLLVGGIMFRLSAGKPDATLLWPEDPKPTRRVLSVTSTAHLSAGYLYSARLNGELVCLEADTGRQVWTTNTVTDLKPGASIHIAQVGDSVLLFTDRGELIHAQLAATGYRELARARLVTPTTPFAGRNVAWAPPAFANGHVFVRTSKELVCASLGAPP